MDIEKLCRDNERRVIDLRREFHEHPELSYRETWTSGRIQQELARLGIPFDLVPNTSDAGLLARINVPVEAAGAPLNVVGRIEGTAGGGSGGRKFALRADFDALPVQEETDLPFRSKIPGVSHACGHDGHAAMLLGAADALNRCRDSFTGTVYLCFQSGEEIGGGAPQIVEYLRGRGGVDGVAALHIWGSIPSGKILLREGSTMAGMSSLRATVKGRGGHGSRPDLVNDPIKAACDLTLKLSSLPSNYYDVMDHCAVHVCMIQAGTASNIFPDTARIVGGVRYFKKGGHEKIRAAMRRQADGVAASHGVEIDLESMPVLIPVVNDAALVRMALEVVSEMRGLAALPAAEPVPASDNFCFIAEAFRSVYGFLGGASGEGWEQHSSHFDIDESVLVKGTEFLAKCAVEFLR